MASALKRGCRFIVILFALLLEARLIKEMHPLFNQTLRSNRHICFNPARARMIDNPAAWQLQRLDAGADAFAALAWRGTPRRIRLFALADAG